MSGHAVYVPPDEHGCEPPLQHVEFVRVSAGRVVNHAVRWVPGAGSCARPALPRRSVWRCECGRFWTVGGTVKDEWRAASWWERRAAQRREQKRSAVRAELLPGGNRERV